ncbi:hypothetical protein B0H11DRAFT_1755680, partial [Mycena galericulata]
LQHLSPFDRSPSSIQSPLFLGHICRKWRDISLSTPSLWTSITLLLGNVTAHQRQLHLLELWLSRSRSCPLLISLHFDPSYLPSNAPAVSVTEFIEAILPHCGRWKDVQLMAPTADLLPVHGDMPLLEISVSPPQTRF